MAARDTPRDRLWRALAPVQSSVRHSGTWPAILQYTWSPLMSLLPPGHIFPNVAVRRSTCHEAVAQCKGASYSAEAETPDDCTHRCQARPFPCQYVSARSMVFKFVTRPRCETVMEARDIKDVPNRPALYVSAYLSGEKLGKTKIARSARPTWDHICPM
jgi:hypothetical protein